MKKHAAKAGKAKASGKRATPRDLSAKKDAAVKGGVTLNYTKIEYKPQQQ